jgi:hypothetical protein
VRSSILVYDHIDHETKFDMAENNFKIAFTILNAKTGKVLDDPAYVDWNVWIERSTMDSDSEYIDLSIHKCTGEDFKDFYNATKKLETIISKI